MISRVEVFHQSDGSQTNKHDHDITYYRTLTDVLCEYCANALPVDQNTLLPHSEVSLVLVKVGQVKFNIAVVAVVGVVVVVASAVSSVPRPVVLVGVVVPDDPVRTEEADHVENQGHVQHGDARFEQAVRAC